MRYLLKQNKKKELILLSLLYLASQGMLLIVSGRWWDDWCFHNQPYYALKNMAMQLGRPTLIIIIKITKLLPESGYRIISYIMFYFCMLFTYKILRLWLKADDRACFWICALYAIVPANDARILLAVFPYSIGLFFFMAGFSYFAGVLYEGRLGIKQRLFSWGLFLLSFILNSNLCFYALILLMIIMKEKRIKRCLKYLDYLLLPIIYFVLKTYFFPVYGVYAGYNVITLQKLINALKLIIPADYKMIRTMLITFKMAFKSKVTILIWGTILFVVCTITQKKNIGNILVALKKRKNIGTVIIYQGQAENDNCLQTFGMIIIGIITLSAGLYSYVAVRETDLIEVSGLGGRDAALVALGVSIIIYYSVNLMAKRWLQKYIFITAIFSGILFFNGEYLSYQQDYYRQLGFQYQLSQNMELNDAKNIVYINSDIGGINVQSFYQLNGNAEEVFKRQDKFIRTDFSDVGDASYCVTSGNYHMSDYDYNHTEIDAVVEYSLKTDLLDTLKMKIYELVWKEKFDAWIVNRSSMNVYIQGTKEFDDILVKYGYENE